MDLMCHRKFFELVILVSILRVCPWVEDVLWPTFVQELRVTHGAVRLACLMRLEISDVFKLNIPYWRH